MPLRLSSSAIPGLSLSVWPCGVGADRHHRTTFGPGEREGLPGGWIAPFTRQMRRWQTDSGASGVGKGLRTRSFVGGKVPITDSVCDPSGWHRSSTSSKPAASNKPAPLHWRRLVGGWPLASAQDDSASCCSGQTGVSGSLRTHSSNVSHHSLVSRVARGRADPFCAGVS